MPFRHLYRVPVLRDILYGLAQWRVKEKLEEIVPHLNSTDSILDVGSGNSVLCHELRKCNYDVTPLDIADVSFIDSVKPIIYDGVKIPFEDSYFDVALLITVLHHTRFPEELLIEAKRVSKRIIVIEEIFLNTLDKYLTYFVDSVFNFEFFGHPHANMTDHGWHEVFERSGLTLIDAKYKKSIWILRRVTYVLEKQGSSGSH